MATVDAQPSPSGFTKCVLYPLEWDGDLEDLQETAKPIGQWSPVGGFHNGVVLCQ